jgi:hypothetical protein
MMPIYGNLKDTKKSLMQIARNGIGSPVKNLQTRYILF